MKPSEMFTKITRQTGLYNIQAIDNIPSIMQRGLLSNERAAKIEHTSIAMQEAKEQRNVALQQNIVGNSHSRVNSKWYLIL
ncbi:MAG: DUF4433 domain-containing protein [Lachnospiraceae bacterium]|nr:DUF4433 domain-containing protein [Lachnospiraceae bacterium]